MFYVDPSGHDPEDNELTDYAREIAKDFLNDHRDTRLNEYLLFELYEERVNLYDTLSNHELWNSMGITEDEKKILFIKDYDFIFNKPSEKGYIEEYAIAAKVLSEMRACKREEMYVSDSNKFYLWNNFNKILDINELTGAFETDIVNFKIVYEENRKVYDEIA